VEIVDNMTQHSVIGYTTDELIKAMLNAGIHCSVDRFKALAIEIQQRALQAQNKEKTA
jgi:hypothetical protein